MISHNILPIAYRDYLPPPDGNTLGLGDITQSLFFSPKAPGPSGIMWGVEPALLVLTATDDFLGTGKFGIGPTAVVLKQPWPHGPSVCSATTSARWPEKRDRRCQLDVPAALSGQCPRPWHDDQPQYGLDLRLGVRPVDGAD